MSGINLDGKIFYTLFNSNDGDVDHRTHFYYHQKDDYIWAHYKGGRVATGVLIGKVLEGSKLNFTYSHFDQEGIFKAGKCESQILILHDGSIKLEEEWEWTTGNRSKGQSTLLEKKD